MRLYSVIPPETVQVGDTVRFSYQREDVTVSVTGTVATQRTSYDNERVSLTAAGIVVCRWKPDKKLGTVELIARPETPQETLFDIGELRERI